LGQSRHAIKGVDFSAGVLQSLLGQFAL